MSKIKFPVRVKFKKGVEAKKLLREGTAFKQTRDENSYVVVWDGTNTPKNIDKRLLIIIAPTPIAQSNEPTIEQMNEAIARFMGGNPVQHNKKYRYITWPKGHATPVDELNYHKDWSRLMPVVEKIESIGNAVRIYTGHTTISTKEGIPICQIVDKTKISATHKAVYKFITWYNQQPQTNGQNNAGYESRPIK